MHSVGIQYAKYLQRKYGHKGHVCEGPFKAKLIRGSNLNRYIHQYIIENPTKAGLSSWVHVGISP